MRFRFGRIGRVMMFVSVVGVSFLMLVPLAAAATNQVAWIKRFGDSRNSDFAYATALDSSGNVYVGGQTFGTIPGQQSYGIADGFLRKYSASGQILWTRQFGPNINWANVSGVAIGGGGNIYIVGTAAQGTSIYTPVDAFIRKYDPSGRLLWTRWYVSPGQGHAALAGGVAVGSRGTVYVVGSEWGFPYDVGTADAFIRAYSPRGGVYWTRKFDSAGDDWAMGVDIDSRGSIYVVGSTTGVLPRQRSIGGQDGFIRKYSPRGGIYWTRQFGHRTDDEARDVVVDAGHNAYVVGVLGSNKAFARKFSPEGSSLWARSWTKHQAEGAAIDPSNNLYVVGYYQSSPITKSFVRKFTPGGTLFWSRNYSRGMAFDAATNVNYQLYVAGCANDCRMGEGGVSDATLAKFD